jgi:predicted RNase H-like HicB family nuclease
MNKETIFLVKEDIEGGYTAKALSLPIFTEAETLEELKEKIKDALKCHFENEKDIPKIIYLHIVKEEIVAYA